MQDICTKGYQDLTSKCPSFRCRQETPCIIGCSWGPLSIATRPKNGRTSCHKLGLQSSSWRSRSRQAVSHSISPRRPPLSPSRSRLETAIQFRWISRSFSCWSRRSPGKINLVHRESESVAEYLTHFPGPKTWRSSRMVVNYRLSPDAQLLQEVMS